MRSSVAFAMLEKRYCWKQLQVRLVVRRVGSREGQTRCGMRLSGVQASGRDTRGSSSRSVGMTVE